MLFRRLPWLAWSWMALLHECVDDDELRDGGAQTKDESGQEAVLSSECWRAAVDWSALRLLVCLYSFPERLKGEGFHSAPTSSLCGSLVRG